MACGGERLEETATEWAEIAIMANPGTVLPWDDTACSCYLQLYGANKMRMFGLQKKVVGPKPNQLAMAICGWDEH